MHTYILKWGEKRHGFLTWRVFNFLKRARARENILERHQAFVEVVDPSAAANAVKLSGTDVSGRACKIALAPPRPGDIWPHALQRPFLETQASDTHTLGPSPETLLCGVRERERERERERARAVAGALPPESENTGLWGRVPEWVLSPEVCFALLFRPRAQSTPDDRRSARSVAQIRTARPEGGTTKLFLGNVAYEAEDADVELLFKEATANVHPQY